MGRWVVPGVLGCLLAEVESAPFGAYVGMGRWVVPGVLAGAGRYGSPCLCCPAVNFDFYPEEGRGKPMFTREKVEKILEKAREIDSGFAKALQKELEWWRGRFKR